MTNHNGEKSEERFFVVRKHHNRRKADGLIKINE